MTDSLIPSPIYRLKLLLDKADKELKAKDLKALEETLSRLRETHTELSQKVASLYKETQKL